MSEPWVYNGDKQMSVLVLDGLAVGMGGAAGSPRVRAFIFG